jgi:hypothetical protein
MRYTKKIFIAMNCSQLENAKVKYRDCRKDRERPGDVRSDWIKGW